MPLAEEDLARLGRAVDHGIQRKAQHFLDSYNATVIRDARSAQDPQFAFAAYVSKRFGALIERGEIENLVDYAKASPKERRKKWAGRPDRIPSPTRMQMVGMMQSLDYKLPGLEMREDILHWPPAAISQLIRAFHENEMRLDIPSPPLEKPRLSQDLGRKVDIKAFAAAVVDFMNRNGRSVEFLAAQLDGVKPLGGNASQDLQKYRQDMVDKLQKYIGGKDSTRIRLEPEIRQWDDAVFETLRQVCGMEAIPLRQRAR